jgi:hypothetical protein
MLSDNGSSIAFAEESYMQEIGIRASGSWTGFIETINQCVEVTTPFFKLVIKLEEGSYTLFALGCNTLGSREQIPQGIIEDICKLFRANPTHVFRGGGKVRILIGQDSGSLLLKPLTHICDKPIAGYLPNFAKDLSLQTTPASSVLSVAGSIGKGCSMDGNTSLYRCNSPKQHNDFFNKPDADDLKWLSETHSNST